MFSRVQSESVEYYEDISEGFEVFCIVFVFDIFELVWYTISADFGEISNFSLAGTKQELNNFVLFPFFLMPRYWGST